MDVLSDIFRVLRLRGTLHFRTEFNPPWGVRVPAFKNVARFHLVIRGGCWVRVPSADIAAWLGPGDLVVIPHGAEHILSDARGTSPITVDEVVSRAGFHGEGALVYGGQEWDRAANLVCGHFQFDEEAMHPLLEALPPQIHVKGSDSLNYTWLDGAMRFLGSEAGSGRPGSEAIIHRLSEIVFIQVARSYLDIAGDRAHVFAAIADRQVGRSLRAMHADPKLPWTLDDLAKEAGMSRSRFAARFRELMPMTPMEYLALWRLQLARLRLLEGGGGILDVALQTGYQSEAAFSRAFKKAFGASPSIYRRRRLAA